MEWFDQEDLEEWVAEEILQITHYDHDEGQPRAWFSDDDPWRMVYDDDYLADGWKDDD